ncbi:MAG TPA: phenylalanine--tRNA ligase subunit beta, partial [Candidatus Paceibacterota bacterium]
MKVSREWLQRYFEKPLPDAEKLADALTFHAFEIESVEKDILDVKVTPNRGHDCLSHRGIAKELSAIVNVPMKGDPLRMEVSLTPTTNEVSVSIDETQLCPRYIAGLIRGVKVGPSPHWLRNFLESIGQQSINNIVDAANFVMFSLGQPLHAFDAGQLSKKEGYAIGVRRAKVGEKLLALDEKEYVLAENMLVITDRHAEAAIGIAGVKGGKPTGISETTTDIIIESANFDGVSTRKSASALKLRTDASSRYEQVISPDLCAYGMRAVADLILELAGGEIAGFVDEYPTKQERTAVSATTASINGILGSALTDADVGNALQRLDLRFTRSDDAFVVEPPFERLDLTIPEDIAEEVGRIVGYYTIKPSELPPLSKKPEINPDFFAAERAREDL